MQQPNPKATGPQRTETSAVAVQAKEIARTGTEQVKDIAQTAKQRAMREIESKRKNLAGEVEKLAGALEKHAGQGDAATPIIDFAATAVRQLGNAIGDRSVEELFRTVKRNPVAVLAASFALGFITTRLFKA